MRVIQVRGGISIVRGDKRGIYHTVQIFWTRLEHGAAMALVRTCGDVHFFLKEPVEAKNAAE